MNFSNRVSLIDLFNYIDTEDYAVVKLNENFPNYLEGSDIDIFCENVRLLSQKIIYFGLRYLSESTSITVYTINEKHLQIDFIFDGNLDIKFDVYGKFPDYEKFKIKAEFFHEIIENVVRYKDLVKVPSCIDELIIRYLEYLEYFNVRNDKIKHLYYVQNALTDPELEDFFYKKLYRITAFPERKRVDPILYLEKIKIRVFTFLHKE